ncbi:unnamed protein product [Rotaria magnacalcarata]|uniref:Uncharacterized protein n=1 Tax=Rotaria magnacalcarata TaxID=392030 RepID=A0A816G1I3_9BILA|nr:unnamed protein product [Rotaria magnacalcarata]CAF1668466.1 unnamed protein product [Rotaria magnacalcarata]CAF2086700.1 unnamed protein product [Rotaria magnacalcarata]CAF2128944.1 unnamed protein product [Rotaria magnacalcarata]CAF3799419.1 unnamed protein product [Rotaria magnacalcarata]
MIIGLFHFLLCCFGVDGIHFNGGTITWKPVYPLVNSSSVLITIIQSYSWTYPTILCANNVPITTPGRSGANTNLSCVSSCGTDGGYSTKPVNILTDCVSTSSSLGMMSSSRSVNISLTAGAHFYLAFQGSAWTALDDPAVSGLYWSIVTFINLRLRPDGFINTPPEATVVSPQYAIVNQTTQINIPVSDVNPGDDVRCRWSMMIPGQRKRRLAHEYERFHSDFTANHYRKLTTSGETAHIRNKRKPNGGITPNPCTTKLCSKSCKGTCPCVCPSCSGTTCTGVTCNQPPKSSCPTGTTTAETPGTRLVYIYRHHFPFIFQFLFSLVINL